MKQTLYMMLFLSVFSITVKGQLNYTQKDSLIFEKYIHQIQSENKVSDMPMNELIVKTAMFFADTPYIANTLDTANKEELTINLREFDCTTFIENCIGLSKTVKSKNPSFSKFCDELKSIRYRNGKIEDYSSRLHYMSDWTYENQKKGVLLDMSEKLGGILDNRPINYMSVHPSSYAQLKDNPTMLHKIKDVENKINKRGGHYVVLKQNIENLNDHIKTGDIIIFATSIDGLDYTHVGIAYNNKDTVTFIHASSKAKKVTTEKQTLAEYCKASNKCTGITVLSING